MRDAKLERKTRETDIKAYLAIDGSGKANVDTGCGFLDHMLRSFAANAMFDLEVVCRGDVEVDYHHTTEDVGIVLGTVFSQAVTAGGVTRYGSAFIPMDEALVMAAVDLSGRPCLEFSLDIPSQKVGDFDTELVEEFFNGFVRKSGVGKKLASHYRSRLQGVRKSSADGGDDRSRARRSGPFNQGSPLTVW